MPGDVIRVRAMDGKLKIVRLGERIAPGVFEWYGTEDEQDGRRESGIRLVTIVATAGRARLNLTCEI